ncbi:hypothetical protein [Halorussus sp. AFM4]|uniref:hypothetical protein n=1 Tax=Halorussus sp. AFM4 TaxID=3421651 RepID=UPI003EB87376
MSEANETASVPEAEPARSALSRVLNLSILFAGIGIYSVVGLGLEKVELFASLQLTYFAVGTVVGVVGVLLWLVTR